MSKLAKAFAVSSPWIDKYGTAAVLLMLLMVMNPEIRAFLLLTNYIGADLMIFFIAIQLRYLLPAAPSFLHTMRTFLCVAGYSTLRFATRMTALLLAPGDRATAGLDHIVICFINEHVVPNAETHHSMRMARKSLTLVSVGPVITESPSAVKKLCASLLPSMSLGRMPSDQARPSELGPIQPPAISS